MPAISLQGILGYWFLTESGIRLTASPIISIALETAKTFSKFCENVLNSMPAVNCSIAATAPKYPVNSPPIVA